jgi:hypothetical protein
MAAIAAALAEQAEILKFTASSSSTRSRRGSDRGTDRRPAGPGESVKFHNLEKAVGPGCWPGRRRDQADWKNDENLSGAHFHRWCLIDHFITMLNAWSCMLRYI